MREISLEAITISGFKSFKIAQTIRFSQAPGLKYITGKNLEKPRLGANGAGKSSIFDALLWCMCGVSVRGKKLSDALLSASKAEVTTSWKIDGVGYALTRKGPPNKLYLNDRPIEQDEVVNLLGLSRDRFLHSVLFGQAVPLFYDLSSAARGELLDEVLDLGLWLKLSELTDTKIKAHNAQLTQIDSTIARLHGKLEGLPQLLKLQEQEAAWEAQHNADVERAIANVERAEAELAEQEALLARATKLYNKYEPIQANLKQQLNANSRELVNYRAKRLSIESKFKDMEKSHQFWKDCNTCPTCGQPITDEFAHTHLAELEQQADALQAEVDNYAASEATFSKRAQALEVQWYSANQELGNYKSERMSAEKGIKHLTRSVETLTAEAQRLMDTYDNPYTSQIEEVTKEHVATTALIEQRNQERLNVAGNLHLVEYWKSGFKKVRLFLVKRILAQIELETANAANALGLTGWRISFVNEIETKSGTMKPGVHIPVMADDRSGELSPGELQRIRLAVALGFSRVIQRMAGVVYRFAVFDEPTNWLSEPGVADLLSQLKYYADSQQKSVWLIDHRAFMFSGFDEIWQVTKTVEGSTVARIAV